jgi:3-oxoacyl-[acyl-carrier protein] reductase
MDLGIGGKVALVTGGARSLGKADATVLAGEGCKVAIVDLNAEGAEEAAKELAAAGGVARGYGCDIRETAQVQDAVSRIERELGPVDICVNNAGMIYTVGQLKDMRDEDWEFNLAVNLTGTMKITRAVFPGMRERRWGRIVCMASIAGLMGGFGQTAYSTSKIGVIGFAKSVALEGARYNVTCNAVAPGIIAPNREPEPAVRAYGQASGDAAGGTAGRRGVGDRVPVLGARPLHHRRRAAGHRRYGPVHVLRWPTVERRSPAQPLRRGIRWTCSRSEVADRRAAEPCAAAPTRNTMDLFTF